MGDKLYSAAERGKMDEVDAAIKRDADVHWKNSDGKYIIKTFYLQFEIINMIIFDT